MVLLNQMRVPISRPRYKEVRGRALEYLNNSVNCVNAILDAKNDVSDTVCSN